MQCTECGRWMRLHGRDANGAQTTRFFGGCDHNNGGDHLAGRVTFDKYHEVCDGCCQTACKAIAASRAA